MKSLIRIAAVSALHQAIKLLIQAGNFRQAADREKEVRLPRKRVSAMHSKSGGPPMYS